MTPSAASPQVLPAPDRAEVTEAARRFLDSGLACVIEAEAARRSPGSAPGWEPRLMVCPSAEPVHALNAVEDTVARFPEVRVRMAGYDPSTLRRVPSPPALVCSPPLARALRSSRPR